VFVCILPEKAVTEMTHTVLNPAHSVTHEVIIENFLHEVRKVLLRGQRLRETLYELRRENFQR